jgi:hypothetical protein
MRYLLSILALTILFSSCYPEEPERNENFMAISDCVVYKDEVKSEPITHGKIEYIDTTIASGCVIRQLKNVYLLYYDTICVTTYNRNPRNNFKQIERFIKLYHSDTTQLSKFSSLNDEIRISVDRLCTDLKDTNDYGKYFEWKDITFILKDNIWRKKDQAIITVWHKWPEQIL